ncbi:MAG: 5-nucleotidase [Myxococcales bacterium]|nr:5-nucleotidase [Myxococcales bacterium]
MKSAVVLAAFAIACSHPPERAHPTAVVSAPSRERTLTIIGTNDLHGAMDRLPLLAGFVDNIRAARAADGGGMLLVDAGDLFQGTLESNAAEGADVVLAYNAMGYAASALGNHELDYGPVGPAVTAKTADDDPRGALKARMHEAKFPFLVSNIVDDKTGSATLWPASVIVQVAGIAVGIVGASTQDTPTTTMPANFVGLRMTPDAQAIAREAKALRDRGAQVIVVAAHMGSSCTDLDHPNDTSSCDRGEELFKVLDELPKGLVDVFVAGHTHAAIAHRIDGVAVIESYSSGRAFGRVDLRITDAHVTAMTIHKPQLICPLDKDRNPVALADCHPDSYEGKPVVADAAVQKIIDDALARSETRRHEKLGVVLSSTITKAYGTESAEGNLLTDLMRQARPEADIALTNGGGLRQDLPGGELTYGQLFAAMPFDNRFALVEASGKQIRRLVTKNLQRGGGIFSWSGIAAKARCKADRLEVEIKVGGKPLEDDKQYRVVTSDFLASGGDGVLGKLPDGAIKLTDTIIREAIADVLRKTKGTIDPAKLFGPKTKRLDYEGKRPVECGGKPAPEPD